MSHSTKLPSCSQLPVFFEHCVIKTPAHQNTLVLLISIRTLPYNATMFMEPLSLDEISLDYHRITVPINSRITVFLTETHCHLTTLQYRPQYIKTTFVFNHCAIILHCHYTVFFLDHFYLDHFAIGPHCRKTT